MFKISIFMLIVFNLKNCQETFKVHSVQNFHDTRFLNLFCYHRVGHIRFTRKTAFISFSIPTFEIFLRVNVKISFFEIFEIFLIFITFERFMISG